LLLACFEYQIKNTPTNVFIVHHFPPFRVKIKVTASIDFIGYVALPEMQDLLFNALA
jgi:hypothetical protein